MHRSRSWAEIRATERGERARGLTSTGRALRSSHSIAALAAVSPACGSSHRPAARQLDIAARLRRRRHAGTVWMVLASLPGLDMGRAERVTHRRRPGTLRR